MTKITASPSLLNDLWRVTDLAGCSYLDVSGAMRVAFGCGIAEASVEQIIEMTGRLVGLDDVRKTCLAGLSAGPIRALASAPAAPRITLQPTACRCGRCPDDRSRLR